jgi:hypothetical protein
LVRRRVQGADAGRAEAGAERARYQLAHILVIFGINAAARVLPLSSRLRRLIAPTIWVDSI